VGMRESKGAECRLVGWNIRDPPLTRWVCGGERGGSAVL